MDNVVHYIIFWWEQYWGSSWYPYLWAAAFLYLLIFERKRKNTGYLIAFQCLLCFLYFCPVTAALIQKCIGGLVYWRVIWLFPVVPALALVVTSLLSRIRKKGPAGGSCNCLCRNSGCKRHQCMECRKVCEGVQSSEGSGGSSAGRQYTSG